MRQYSYLWIFHGSQCRKAAHGTRWSWFYHRSSHTLQKPVDSMTMKIQRKHPQTPAINHTLLTVLENFMETSKRSNHKITSLLLKERRQNKIWPPSHLTHTREHITEITLKKFSKVMVEVHRSNLLPTIRWISHKIFYGKYGQK